MSGITPQHEITLILLEATKKHPTQKDSFRDIFKNIRYATLLCGDKVLLCKYNIEQGQTSRIAAKVEINGIDWKKELTEL